MKNWDSLVGYLLRTPTVHLAGRLRIQPHCTIKYPGRKYPAGRPMVQLNEQLHARGFPEGSTLNPRFVEWMMGYPPGWTIVDTSDIRSRAWGTPSSRRLWRGSGDPFSWQKPAFHLDIDALLCQDA